MTWVFAASMGILMAGYFTLWEDRHVACWIMALVTAIYSTIAANELLPLEIANLIFFLVMLWIYAWKEPT